MITQERLRELVTYDPISGCMSWKMPRRKCAVGKTIGRTQWQGYRQACIDRKHYYVHRLVWLYMTGTWPPHDIDHVNQDKGDNRWTNLRLATRSENKANCRVQSNNKVGLRGVSWSVRDRVYEWAVKKGKTKIRGFSSCPAAAHFSYVIAAEKLFGEFVPGGGV